MGVNRGSGVRGWSLEAANKMTFSRSDRNKAILFCSIMASSFGPFWEREDDSVSRDDAEELCEFYTAHYHLPTRVWFLVGAATRATMWKHESSVIRCPCCGHESSEHARTMFAEAECLLREGWSPGDPVEILSDLNLRNYAASGSEY